MRKPMFIAVGVMTAIVLLIIGVIWSGKIVSSARIHPSDGLHIEDSHIVDMAGKQVFLTGFSISGPEYLCTPLIQEQVQPSQLPYMRSWGANTLRIPLSEAYWIDSDHTCPGYRTQIDQIVQSAEHAGFNVIITLAWISPLPGGYSGGAGYPLPDHNAIPFWQSVAGVYAHDTHMIFEIYSEPHDVTWKQWRDGGTIITTNTQDRRIAGTYDGVGMQQLVTLVNHVAPERIALVSGREWGGDLSGVLSPYQLQGANIAYGLHLYPGPNSIDPGHWANRFGDLARKAPVIASEFGQLDCGQDFLGTAMPYLATHTQGMIAWTWDQGDCGRPGLLTDWQGTPTSYGAAIQRFFQGINPHSTG